MSFKVQLFEGASILISKVFGLILFGTRSGHLFSYIIISIVIFGFLKFFLWGFHQNASRASRKGDRQQTDWTDREMG